MRQPKTPFATRLSGDAKETELRIRSIFQWNKMRPPVWLMLCVMLLVVGCCGLVAWNHNSTSTKPGVSMALQYYDNFGNVAEIPEIMIPDNCSEQEKEILTTMNSQLGWLADGYETAIKNLDTQRTELRVLCYPSVGERYLSVLIQEEARSDAALGLGIPTLTSWVYDADEKAMLNEVQALELAETTLEELLVQLNQQMDLDPMDPWDVTDVSLQAFFVDRNDEVTLYLVARTSGLGDAEYDRLYSWNQGEFIRIDMFDEERPLLSVEQTERMEKPLWNEWKFTSGMPEGGFIQLGLNEAQRQQLLAQAGFAVYEYRDYPPLTTLLAQTIGNRTVMLVETEGGPHIAGTNNLVMGVFDEETQRFVGDVYTIGGDEAGYTFWWGNDNCLYVLWSNNTIYQGIETSGGVNCFRFDGQTLQPVYDLPATSRNCGVLPDAEEAAALLKPISTNVDSREFWSDHKARPIDGGFYFYETNPDWDSSRPGEGEQWRYMGYVPFVIQDHIATEQVKELIKEYLKNRGPYGRTYYLDEELGEPQEDDQRIDGVYYSGEERTHETTGVAFRVESSYYNTWHSEDPGPSWREGQNTIYLILGKDADGQFYEVRGDIIPDGDKSINQMIQEVSYGLLDLEVSLWRDGYPSPVGPGSEIPFFRDVYDGEPKVEILEGWEPVYWPGAYWTRQSWDGFSALCYHVGEEPGQDDPDAYSVYTIDTTRDDLKTYRGIHVGSTREEVLEAYPGIFDTHYWHDDAPDFPGKDYLWYCDNPDGWGAALLFFFEENKVSHMRLNHMFN